MAFKKKDMSSSDVSKKAAGVLMAVKKKAPGAMAGKKAKC